MGGSHPLVAELALGCGLAMAASGRVAAGATLAEAAVGHLGRVVGEASAMCVWASVMAAQLHAAAGSCAEVAGEGAAGDGAMAGAARAQAQAHYAAALPMASKAAALLGAAAAAAAVAVAEAPNSGAVLEARESWASAVMVQAVAMEGLGRRSEALAALLAFFHAAGVGMSMGASADADALSHPATCALALLTSTLLERDARHEAALGYLELPLAAAAAAARAQRRVEEEHARASALEGEEGGGVSAAAAAAAAAAATGAHVPENFSASANVEGAMRGLLTRLVRLRLGAVDARRMGLLRQLLALRASSCPGVGSSPTVVSYILWRLLGEGGAAFDPAGYCAAVIAQTLEAVAAGDDAALTTPAGLLLLSQGAALAAPPAGSEAPAAASSSLPHPPEPCLLDQLGALMELARGEGSGAAPTTVHPPPCASTALLTQIGAIVTGAPLAFTGRAVQGLYDAGGVGFQLWGKC